MRRNGHRPFHEGRNRHEQTRQSIATILIASDNASDAALVKKLLDPEFEHTFISTDPNRAKEDFERRHPDVLVLAFNALEKSERYYLGLYRLCPSIHQHPTAL